MPELSLSVDDAAEQGLTRREQEVLLAMARGQSTRALSETSRTAQGTVRTHIANLERKLGATGRAHLIARAMELGILFVSSLSI